MALKNTFECNNKICPNDHIDLHKAYVKYYSINDYIIMANTPEKKLTKIVKTCIVRNYCISKKQHKIDYDLDLIKINNKYINILHDKIRFTPDHCVKLTGTSPC